MKLKKKTQLGQHYGIWRIYVGANDRNTHISYTGVNGTEWSYNNGRLSGNRIRRDRFNYPSITFTK